jgi:flagellar biosynthesis component FlhA
MNCQKIEVNARKSVFGFFGLAVVAVLVYCWEVTLILLAVIAVIAAIVVAFIAIGYIVAWLSGEAHICQASRDAHEQKQEQEQLEYMKRQGADDKAIAWQVKEWADIKEEKALLARMKKEKATKEQMQLHRAEFYKKQEE